MKVWQLLLIVTYLVGVYASQNVVEFDIVEKIEPWQIIRPGIHRNIGKFKLGGTFNESTCNGGPVPSSWPFQIEKLSIMPDPIVLPGKLTLSFTVKVTRAIVSPLKADVYMAMQAGSTWIKIPCIGFIGSCTIDDLCDVLEPVQCPDAFVAAGVPCKCPFKPGTYVLPPFDIDIDSGALPSGEIRIMANLSENSKIVGCYNVTDSIVNG